MTESFATRLDGAMKQGWVAAYRWLRDPDAARDALQEAATRALAARDRYDATRPFYPWFYRILRNHCMDRLKRGQRETGLADDSDSGATTSSPDNPVVAARLRDEPAAERALIAAERARSVEAAIADLPADLREILELRHFQELSYFEIADALEIPQGTVMSRLYRARRALRDALLRTPDFADRRPR